jgi:hypothetical protein
MVQLTFEVLLQDPGRSNSRNWILNGWLWDVRSQLSFVGAGSGLGFTNFVILHSFGVFV